MFFLFLISLHVHIKRPYRFPLINISLFCCAGGIYLGLGPWFYRYINPKLSKTIKHVYMCGVEGKRRTL